MEKNIIVDLFLAISIVSIIIVLSIGFVRAIGTSDKQVLNECLSEGEVSDEYIKLCMQKQ